MSEFLYHFYIILNTFFYSLSLDIVSNFLKIVDLLYQVVLYFPNSNFCLFLARHEKIRRINFIFIERRKPMERHRIDFLYRVDFVIPPSDSQNIIAVSHRNVDSLSLNSEIATLQVNVVTNIKSIDKLAKENISVELLPLVNLYDTRLHGNRSAHTIDA